MALDPPYALPRGQAMRRPFRPGCGTVWNTFEIGQVVEEVQSDDDILAASEQSALHVTEELSEEEVQRVNQELKAMERDDVRGMLSVHDRFLTLTLEDRRGRDGSVVWRVG